MTEPAQQRPIITDEATRRILRWLPFAMLGHLFVGIPALALSLIVAWATYVQATATQQMQQAATWPAVSYYTSNYDAAGKHRIELTLVNNGVGPAIVGPVELRYQGRPVRDAVDLLTACCGYRKGQSISFSTNFAPGSVMRPGERIEFFGIADTPDNAAELRALERERYAIDVRACYCSIFDDCWTVHGPRSKPKPVDQCPADWAVYGDQSGTFGRPWKRPPAAR